MIYKFKWLVASVFILSSLMLEPAYAESMRCGQHIISSGERHGTDKYEVLKKCGEPTIRAGNTWIYEKSHGAKTIVTFDDSGKVSRIE